jgi:hypothetical protein
LIWHTDKKSQSRDPFKARAAPGQLGAAFGAFAANASNETSPDMGEDVAMLPDMVPKSGLRHLEKWVVLPQPKSISQFQHLC